MAGIQSGRKLSLDALWQAVSFPFKNAIAVVRLGLLPVLISAVILYTASLMAPLIGGRSLLHIIRLMLDLVVASVVAVGIHRLILRTEQPEWTILRYRNYEIAYGATVLIFAGMTVAVRGVIQSLAASPVERGLIESLGRLIGWISPQLYIQLLVKGLSPGLVAIVVLLIGAVIWPTVRLALVFPHAAVTGQLSFSESWAMTRGNVWRLIGLIVLLAIIVCLIMALGLVITSTFFALNGPLGFVIFSLLDLVLGGLQFSMFVALISYIYKDLIQGLESIAPLPDFLPTPRPEPET